MLSTPHLTEEARAAALDPDGGGAAGDAARAHAAGCDACRAILEADVAAEQQAQRLLQMLDHPMLHIDFEQVKAIATAYNTSGTATRTSARTPGRKQVVIPRAYQPAHQPAHPRGDMGANVHAARVWRWGWRGIGVVAFGTGAVAAALVPDSAAHRFVARVMDRMVSSIAPKAPVSAAPDAATAATQRGVSIVPSGPVTIAFEVAHPVGMIHVLYGSSAHVTVRASAEGATYAVGPDGIHVDNSGAESLNYTVELPPLDHSTPVRILVGDVVLYAAENGHVTVPALSQPGTSYELPLAVPTHGTTR